MINLGNSVLLPILHVLEISAEFILIHFFIQASLTLSSFDLFHVVGQFGIFAHWTARVELRVRLHTKGAIISAPNFRAGDN